MNVFDSLQGIFREVFDDENITLLEDTSPDDIEGWDSLAQINIILACESSFGIKFDINDVLGIKSVADIVTIIEGKLRL